MQDEDFPGLLQQVLEKQLESVHVIASGLQIELEGRYGPLSFIVDHDASEASLRLYTNVAAPPGSGPEFLRWCLSMNTLYWDIKLGIDSHGRLLVLADIDLDAAPASEQAASAAPLVLARLVAMGQLLDEDLVGYLLDHRLATPAQRQRWTEWSNRL